MKIPFPILMGFLALFVLNISSCKKDSNQDYTGQKGTVTDNDNNTYQTIGIGSQIWMAENLKTTKFNDGTSIPNVTLTAAWSTLTTIAYCWYNNDPATYKATYGALYNWFAVNTGKLCPTGWHLPSEDEWINLSNFLGGESGAGNILKTTTVWSTIQGHVGKGDDSMGFSAFPGGYRLSNGTYTNFADGGNWWTNTEEDSDNARFFHLSYWDQAVHYLSYPKRNGCSIRCVKN